ncbi:MAG: leucyl/phenylalanyl-tRNA--protein transferase [Gammaproteobacteria bacterium]|nr:leucyl/phenylalanyl-tRNA--protein transferase [Gammaproteobacteria bacterium]
MRFPHPEMALDEPDGLLAAGGDLSPQRLVSAYRQGIFPWYNSGEPILWWSPSQRAVLFPERFHVSRSFRRYLNQHTFNITWNQDFNAVIAACAAPRSYANDTWITAEMQNAYKRLHILGYAHSLECWQADELIGGIYGVQLGCVFFGESMFSRISNGSKLALYALAQRADIQLIDCQIPNPHLMSLGVERMTRTEFLQRLEKLLRISAEKPL